MPLTALTGQFPTDPNKTYLAYAESVSAVDYMVRTYGKDALLDARRRLQGRPHRRRGVHAGRSAMDVAAFQAGWLGTSAPPSPQQYGPQPDPTGPVPPGWDAAGRAPAHPVERRPPTAGPAASAATARHGRRPTSERRAGASADGSGSGDRSSWRSWRSSSWWSCRRPRGRRGGARRAVTRARRAGARHPDVAGHPGPRPARARVPDRRPARVRGAADPVHRARSGRRWWRRRSTCRRSRTTSRSRSSRSASGIQDIEAAGQGGATVTQGPQRAAARRRGSPRAWSRCPAPASSSSCPTRRAPVPPGGNERDYLVSGPGRPRRGRGAVAGRR